MNTNQLKYYFSLLRASPFMPLLYHQAKHIKNTMPDLEAPTDNIQSDGPNSFHVLSIGESSIASIGANTQQNGITGYLTKQIRSAKKLKCSYEVIAKSGFTAAKVKEVLLPKISSAQANLVIIGLGANDSFQLSSPNKWRKNVREILDHLQHKFGTVPIVFINMPPIVEFPIFTPMLKYYIHRQISILKKELEQLTTPLENVHFMKNELSILGFIRKYNLPNTNIDDFYSDGVHPSELTYKHWASEVFEYINHKGLIAY